MINFSHSEVVGIVATTHIQTKRLPFIDLMKGLCIILIVVGHVDTALFSALGGNADKMFETFRVPMYYFISGIFFKQYGGFFDFARKKINNILIPFVFFYAFAFIVQMICGFLPECCHFYGEFHWGYAIQPLVQRFWNCNVPLWFLLSLFQVNVFYYLLQLLFKRRLIQVVIVLALAGLGYALCFYHIKPIYYTETSLVGMPFFVLGSILHGVGIVKPHRYDCWGLLVFPLVLLTLYLFAEEIDIYSQILPPYLKLYALSSIAIVSLFWFCKDIGQIPGVNYLGRYSLVLLGTHYVYIPIVRATLGWLGGWHGLLLSFATLLIVLALMFPTVAVFIRIFPRFTAQSEFFKPGWHL